MVTLQEKVVDKEGFTPLVNAGDNFEYEMINSLLESESIPVLEKRKGSGSYLNVVGGFNFQGVDILVKEEDYEKAYEIVEVYMTNQVESDENQDLSMEEEEWAEELDESRNKRRGLINSWYLWLPIIVIAIIALIAAVSS